MKFKSWLLPTAENDYTPHLLQKAALVMMLCLVVLSFSVVNLHALLWQSSNWLVGTVLPAVVVDLTNEERLAEAVLPLQRSAVLDEAARLKAEHMAANQYFAHYSPEGISPWYWFGKVNYNFAHAGENLAIHFTDSDAVVEAWMDSPLHRENIVSNNYTEIGVGTAKGTYDGYDTVYVVQLFGTQAVPVATAMIEPADIQTEVVAEVEESETESEIAASQVDQQVAGEQTSTPTEVVAVETANLVSESSTEEMNEVMVKEKPAPVFSAHFATSSGLEPLALGGVSGTTASEATLVETVATSPSGLLQAIYLTLGVLVAIMLLVSLLIEIRHHRPLQVVYGLGLMLLMSGLFYVHLALTTNVVIAAESGSPSTSAVLNS